MGMADNRIEDILQRGLEFHRKNQFLEAESCYKQALGIDPNNADAIHLLGLLADAIGDKELAVDLVRYAISIQSDNPVFHGNLGNILRAQGRHDEAIACYLEALKFNPQSIEPCFNLATLYRDLDRLEDAIPLYQQATALHPDFAIAWINLATALHTTRQLDEAIYCYKHYLELKPEDIYGKTRLADALHERGRELEDQDLGSEAIALFEEALSVNSSHIASRRKIDFLLSEKKRLAAEANSKAKLDIDTLIREILQRALELHKNDNFSGAAALCRQALSMKASHPGALHLLRMADDAIADQALAAELVNNIIAIASIDDACRPNSAETLGDQDASMLPADEIPQDEGYTFTRLMYDIWASRPDLQKAFDIHQPEKRFEFCKWFLTYAPAEHALKPDNYPENLLTSLLPVSGIIGKKALSMLLARSRDSKQVSVNGAAL